MPVNKASNDRQRGFVLIVTLWVLVILGVMLTNLSYQVRVEAAVERWALNQSQLRWAARGAVHTAAARVREHFRDEFHSPVADWWSDENVYREQTLGQATVSLLRPGPEEEPAFGLDDEESRLNINVAHPEHLMGFPGVSSVVAEAIVLFRLEREEALEEAATGSGRKTDPEPAAEADEENDSNQPVDGPIRSLRELLAVEGVTEELLFQAHEERPPLASLLTTLSSGKININTASEPVLKAIGLSEDAVTAIVERRKEEDTAYQSVDDVLGMIDPAMNPKKRARLEKLLAVRSSTFRLKVEATLPQQKRPHVLEALLSSSDQAMAFVRWRER